MTWNEKYSVILIRLSLSLKTILLERPYSQAYQSLQLYTTQGPGTLLFQILLETTLYTSYSLQVIFTINFFAI